MTRWFTWLLATLCAGGILSGQAMQNHTFRLENGAQVLYQTYSNSDVKDPGRMFGTARAVGNAIERTMTDGTNRTWLGFELHLEKLPGDPIRFRLSMGPLGGEWGFFGQRAPPREIQNGDRILLDVLEEPGTGRKIFDTFQAGIGVEMQLMPMAKTIPQISTAGAIIHLQNPSFLVGGPPGVKVAATSGASAAVVVAGKGRFRFSSRPEPGFRMEAIAEGNRLMFVAGNASYTIECASAIIEGPGAWYLWVRHDPE